jgi:hypothetical protein
MKPNIQTMKPIFSFQRFFASFCREKQDLENHYCKITVAVLMLLNTRRDYLGAFGCYGGDEECREDRRRREYCGS